MERISWRGPWAWENERQDRKRTYGVLPSGRVERGRAAVRFAFLLFHALSVVVMGVIVGIIVFMTASIWLVLMAMLLLGGAAWMLVSAVVALGVAMCRRRRP